MRRPPGPYRSWAALALAGCWLSSGCTPTPDSSPLATPAPTPAWVISLNEPGEEPPYRVSVDGLGRVSVVYQGQLEIHYSVDQRRLTPVKQAVEFSHPAQWTASPGAAGGPTLEAQIQGTRRTHPPQEGDKPLLESLQSLVPRPYASDPQGLWAGGRLVKGGPEGEVELSLEDSDTPSADKALSLVPPPGKGFNLGELVIVAGKLSQDAGIAQRGAIFKVEGLWHWPAAPASPTPGGTRTPR